MMKLMYIYYDSLIPRVVTFEEAVEFLSQSTLGCSNPRIYAEAVLSNGAACGNSSFELNDSGEMLLVVTIK